MLTPEALTVLSHLRRNGGFLAAKRLSGLPGLPGAFADRVLADLEWQNFITVIRDGRGGTALVQLTPQGRGLAPA
jgi:DNA-binding IscR family transcriptional regulator